MEPSAISPWLSLILSAIALATVVYGWFTAGEKKVAKDLSEFSRATSEELGKLEKRVQIIEGELKHLPDREQMHRMELAMERMSGRMDTLAKGVEPIAGIAERWQELILEQAKK